MEIEESAFYRGFPCHLSARLVEDEEDSMQDDKGDQGGFTFGDNTQHCVGYIILRIHEDDLSPWPGIENDDELLDKLTRQVDMKAPVFRSMWEFLDANTEKTA